MIARLMPGAASFRPRELERHLSRAFSCRKQVVFIHFQLPGELSEPFSGSSEDSGHAILKVNGLTKPLEMLAQFTPGRTSLA